MHVSDDDELPGDVFRHQAARANIPVLCDPVPGQGSALQMVFVSFVVEKLDDNVFSSVNSSCGAGS